MRKANTRWLLVLVGLFAFVACDSGGPGDDPGPGVGTEDLSMALSDLPRDETPDISEGDLEGLSADNRAFSWDLYHQVIESSDNLVVSPYSISTALAMTYAGAGGETKTEMADALHFTLSDDELHAGFNAIDLALDDRNLEETEHESALTLSVRNDVWAHVIEEYRPFDSYLDVLAVNYGTGVYLVDFQNPEGARVTINDAVNEWTMGRIEDLLPEGVLTPITTLVLTNTIYMLAPWAMPFEVGLTAPATFHTYDDSEITVDTMVGEPEGAYTAGDGYEAVLLPYRGHQLSMVFLVPDLGTFDDFEAGLTGESADAIIDGLSPGIVRIHLPKFTITSPVGLKPALIPLGMEQAFNPGSADLSGMGPHQVFIQDVIHQAFIEVNEQGTEAAAATAVVIGDESAPPPPVADVHVDRPFIFLIYDIPTGTILFTGRVLDPS